MKKNKTTSEFFSTIGKIGGAVKSEKKAIASRANGRLGGAVKSEKKAIASRANGQLGKNGGGRKPLKIEEMTEAQIKRRERYQAQKIKDEYADL